MISHHIKPETTLSLLFSRPEIKLAVWSIEVPDREVFPKGLEQHTEDF